MLPACPLVISEHARGWAEWEAEIFMAGSRQ